LNFASRSKISLDNFARWAIYGPMALHFALSILTTVNDTGIFVDTQSVAVADVIFEYSAEYFAVRKNQFTRTML
jgi:hypothetical protein